MDAQPAGNDSVSPSSKKEKTARAKGSIVLVALIFSAVISTLVGTYLKLVVGEYQRADSTFMYNALINLAEAGAEEAMWSITNDDWSDWEDGGTYKIQQVSNVSLGTGTSGEYSVMVENPSGDPIIYVEAIAGLKDGRIIRKQIKLELIPRSFFANGLVAKEVLQVNGGAATIDSYDSNAGSPDPTLNRNDLARVGTVSVQFEDLDAGNSDIYGYVATGGGSPAFGPNAKVYGSDWNNGDPNIDPTRVTLDFTADLPPVDPPTMGVGARGDTDADIVFITATGSPDSVTISGGIADAPIEYHLSSLNMMNNRQLVVNSHLLMRVDGDVNISQLTINNSYSLVLYVNGDITVSGIDYANNNTKAETFVVYGTNNTTVKTITLNGSANMTAAVYAPNADIVINGSGSGPGFR